MMIPTVPLVAHFVDNEGRRISSLKVVAIGDQGACFVLWQNRLTPAVTITDPLHKFDRLEYVADEVAVVTNVANYVRPEPTSMPGEADTRDVVKSPKPAKDKPKAEPEVK